MTETKKNTTIPRPPIVVVMGHIDHGKSTLLDTIRDTKVTEDEAGGITQKVSAYEVSAESSDGKGLKMTFLDTPGHEAFSLVRQRGVVMADIAVLIVAADDGVQTQTKEALRVIKENDLPFVVAINKIDKPNSDVEKTKQELLKNDVYLEGYGGSVPVVEISATKGDGVDDLLEMIGLVAEMQEISGDTQAPAEGFVLESTRDPKRGISATLIITNGELSKGNVLVSGKAMTPVRIMEDFLGKKIEKASFSSPVAVIGWSNLPQAGDNWRVHESRKEAERAINSEDKATQSINKTDNENTEETEDRSFLPVVIKADSRGSIEGIKHELEKLSSDRIFVKVIKDGVGPVNEGDVVYAEVGEGISAIILAFQVNIDPSAQNLARRNEVSIKSFDVIYEIVDWLSEKVKKHTPSKIEKEITGQAKIIKVFSQGKKARVVGGKVKSGALKAKERVSIYRRESDIGEGVLKNLQHQKENISSIKEGMEFGAEVESKVDIQPGDIIESFDMVEK